MLCEKITQYLLKGCAVMVVYKVACLILNDFSMSDPYGYYSHGVALTVLICDYLVSLLGGLLVGAGVYWLLWEGVGKWFFGLMKKLQKRRKGKTAIIP